MKEHIFIVKYSNENGWEWDTDLENELLPNGTIWDKENTSWISGWDGDKEDYVDNDDEIGGNLGIALKMMNEVK